MRRRERGEKKRSKWSRKGSRRIGKRGGGGNRKEGDGRGGAEGYI